MLLHFALSILLANFALAVGENCRNPTSLWDTHYCEIFNNEAKYQRLCVPRLSFPVPSRKIKGLLLLYHGWTGCPDAFNQITDVLNSQGFAVVIPLLPGQGINRGYGCEVIGTCVDFGTNPSFQPINKDKYMEWVDWSIRMVKNVSAMIPDDSKANDYYIGTMGLSSGAVLGAYAASRPSSPFERLMLINPAWSWNDVLMDIKVLECQYSANPKRCILEYVYPSLETPPTSMSQTSDKNFTNPFSIQEISAAFKKSNFEFNRLIAELSIGRILSENYKKFVILLTSAMTSMGENRILMNSAITNGTNGWGVWCEDNKLRGGICFFKLRHGLAVQAMAQFTISQLNRIRKNTTVSYINSQKDGAVVDSIAAASIVELLNAGVKVSRCSFKIKKSCKLSQVTHANNLCAAPHSLFSEVEAHAHAPFYPYWKDSLFENVVKFFNKDSDTIGVDPNSKIPDELDGAVCIATNRTLGFGEHFDSIGPAYIKAAKFKYRFWG